MAVFKGNTRAIFPDRKEATGPIDEQIEEAMLFVKRNIRLGSRIAGVYREDFYELPIDTICCHEFVFDGLKDKSTGVTTMDVAKRLLDYGYHAPTIYFPLLFHESLMIEPTENESKETLDGFIAVMRQIAEEAKTNPDEVKTAPHTTPIGRVDDVLAAKHPVVTYRQMTAEATD